MWDEQTVNSFGVAALILICLAATLTLAVLYRRHLLPRHLLIDAEWINALSVERYRPMLRLLNDGDFRLMRGAAGYTSKLESRLRVERCQIFRGYLRCLQADFRRVCLALKLVMTQSQHDRPDLAAALVRNQLRFAYGITRVHCQLVFYRWGWGTVDTTLLLSLFDAMRHELRTLVPEPAPSLA